MHLYILICLSICLNFYKSPSLTFYMSQGSPRNAPSLDPSEILIAIHVIDPDKEGIPLKKVFNFLLFLHQICRPIGQLI